MGDHFIQDCGQKNRFLAETLDKEGQQISKLVQVIRKLSPNIDNLMQEVTFLRAGVEEKFHKTRGHFRELAEEIQEEFQALHERQTGGFHQQKRDRLIHSMVLEEHQVHSADSLINCSICRASWTRLRMLKNS